MYCGWTGIYVQSSCANVETYRLSFLYRCFVFLMVVAFATGKWGNWQVNRKNKTHMYKVQIRLQLNSYCYKSQARGWNKNRSFDSSSGEFLRDKIELFFSLSVNPESWLSEIPKTCCQLWVQKRQLIFYHFLFHYILSKWCSFCSWNLQTFQALCPRFHFCLKYSFLFSRLVLLSCSSLKVTS